MRYVVMVYETLVTYWFNRRKKKQTSLPYHTVYLQDFPIHLQMCQRELNLIQQNGKLLSDTILPVTEKTVAYTISNIKAYLYYVRFYCIYKYLNSVYNVPSEEDLNDKRIVSSIIMFVIFFFQQHILRAFNNYNLCLSTN